MSDISNVGMGSAVALRDDFDDGVPRVQDLDLARRLEMANEHKVVELIERNLEELNDYGDVPTVGESVKRGFATHTVNRYYLNEQQALLLCMFSRTPKAAAVRRELIQVFTAYRNGKLKPLPPREPSKMEIAAFFRDSFFMLDISVESKQAALAVIAQDVFGMQKASLLEPDVSHRDGWLSAEEIERLCGIHRSVVGKEIKAMGFNESDPKDCWKKLTHVPGRKNKQVFQKHWAPHVVEAYLRSKGKTEALHRYRNRGKGLPPAHEPN